MEDVAGQAEEAQTSSGDHGGPQDAAQQQPGSACVRECAGVASGGRHSRGGGAQHSSTRGGHLLWTPQHLTAVSVHLAVLSSTSML